MTQEIAGAAITPLAQAAKILATYVENHRLEFLSTILPAMKFGPAQTHPDFIEEWLDYEIDRLQGQPAYTGEWIARILEIERFRQASIGDTLDNIRIVRDKAVEFLIDQPTGISDAHLFRVILDAENHYITLLVRLHAEEQGKLLTAERRRVRTVIESMGRGFVLLDANGNILIANSQFISRAGLPEKELIGHDFLDFCDHATAIEVRRDLRTKRPSGVRLFEGALITPRGERIPSRLGVSPMFDETGLRNGVAIIISNPSEAAGQGAWFRVENIGTASDAIDLGLVLMDTSFHIQFANNLGRTLQALNPAPSSPSAEPVLPCREFATPKHTCGRCIAENIFNHHKRHASTQRIDLPGQETRWIETICTPLRDPKDQIWLIVKTLQDVTKAKSLENQILRQQSTSMVAQLAMTVAHQLRNPLGVMIGYAEMLTNGLPQEQIQQAVDRILRSGIRCKDIVDDLLAFGRGLPAEQITTTINTLITERVQPMLPAAGAERIIWRLEPNPTLIQCAPAQIAQVLVNLIDNALWAAKSQVLITTQPTPNPQTSNPTLRIEIWDDGPGIPKENRKRIFDSFYSTRKEQGHVGLGLSLARSVIQEHAGRLFLDDRVNAGACFVIELPAAPINTPAPAPTPEPAPPKHPGRHILIVDDEHDLVDMLATALELRGDHVDTAHNATAALQLIHKNQYDLAIIDILLSDDINGSGLYQTLSQTNSELAHKTLFITADTMNIETRQFLEQAKRPHLDKPFLVSSFLEKVNQMTTPPSPPPISRKSKP